MTLTYLIDASFAIAWMLGEEQARDAPLTEKPMIMLPMQYAETLTFFQKRVHDITPVINELEGLRLKNPSKGVLQQAVPLYIRARAAGAKTSLADAILAAEALVSEVV